ncbi:MAG: dioxygenase [Verrucomicrobiales bacterium]|nr:dioxygenase [Verrucomicrobiales bacterium]
MTPLRPAITPSRAPGAVRPEAAVAVPAATRFELALPTPCRHPAPCGLPCELKLGPERHAVLELGGLARLAIMAVPGGRGSFREQAGELFAQVRCIVGRQNVALTPTTLMVFLREDADEAACREIVRETFGDASPVATFVRQPPCCGAALGLELWAVGGPRVQVQRPGPGVLTVESDGIRWVHCGGVRGDATARGPYQESCSAFARLREQLALAGVGLDQVVRTWLYVNQITEGADGVQRYQELNRARTDCYREIQFGHRHRAPWAPSPIYPASTGIGTSGERIDMACLALDTQRSDVFLLPLENPQQTPACRYESAYSPQSPKFSRAMAVVQGHFVSTLVSGTASIVDSRTVHPGDVVRQTEQTLDNIEHLMAPANFERLGLAGAGATLRDVAKLRVYVKRSEDYEACREVVERRLPRVPAIYLVADVCRPDLLVEIEAVAFSRFTPPGS